MKVNYNKDVTRPTDHAVITICEGKGSNTNTSSTTPTSIRPHKHQKVVQLHIGMQYSGSMDGCDGSGHLLEEDLCEYNGLP